MEDEDMGDGEMGGGIVDDDLDVNSTKQDQLRQSLLSTGSRNRSNNGSLMMAAQRTPGSQ